MLNVENNEEAKRHIVEAVNERWVSRQSAYLLSQLGKDFPQELRTMAHGSKLIDTVAEEFDGSLKLISKGEGNQKVWAIVPNNIDTNPATQSIPTSTSNHAIRFQPSVWAAFRIPVPDGHKRLLMQQGATYKFQDIPRDQPNLPGSLVEIYPEDIAQTNQATADVGEHIIHVLQQKNFPLEKVTAGRSAPSAPLKSTFGARSTEHYSLLDAIVECLSPSEIRRVSLPLDILEKLKERKIAR